ncbi:MAG: hypothetical protein PHO32_07230, partial [Candidatus Cloacimonetes bacterium]|nr:hypothetical protein [Candidatus Cloacimonadota bacterium]
ELHCRERINALKIALNLNDNQIAFVFETYANCGRTFIDQFIDGNRNALLEREHPYSNIFPLFTNGADPYYTINIGRRGENRITDPFMVEDAQLRMPEGWIHTPFERILKLIDTSISNVTIDS